MAKTRTLPDKYYDKDYETNGIHRVPLWRIAGFALNNTATNLYLMFIHNAVNFPDGNQRFVMRKADRLAQGVIRHSHVLCPPLTAYFNNGVHADRHIAR